ncbi:MAG: protein kinase [Acidobacteria bacterium]|nr:protein kinase [Acidobacteriota bacterium]
MASRAKVAVPNKKVAVKLPHDDQVDFNTIQREAGLWEEASGHPNVLPIIDAEVYDGQVVIVSEFADGGSLADRLTDLGTTSVKRQSI